MTEQVRRRISHTESYRGKIRNQAEYRSSSKHDRQQVGGSMTSTERLNKKRNKQKRSLGRTLASIFLFFLGLGISVYPYVAQYINSLSDTRLVAAYNASIMNGGGASNSNGGMSGAEGGVAVNPDDLLADVYGTIFIPKLSLELPIYVGSTNENLSRGIAHLEGTSLPVGGESTHSVLAGHNGAITNEWFTHIDQLGKGDLFYIRNGTSVLTYSVYDTKVIEPTDTSELYIEEGRDLVTLLTCIDGGSKRLLVKGERVLE